MGDLKVDQDVGEMATAIRVNLYRHAPDMPSYPEGIVPKVVKPYLEKAFAAGREQGLREAAEVARDGCRCRTCGAYFLGSNGHECERPDWDGLVYSSDYAAAITALIEGEGE